MLDREVIAKNSCETFENNSDMEVKATQKQLSRAFGFCKGNTMKLGMLNT